MSRLPTTYLFFNFFLGQKHIATAVRKKRPFPAYLNWVVYVYIGQNVISFSFTRH